MNQSGASHCPLFRFLVSGISLLGFGLALSSVSLLSGCGDDKGSVTQVENPTDPTKTPGGMDSMKAYMQRSKVQKKGEASK